MPFSTRQIILIVLVAAGCGGIGFFMGRGTAQGDDVAFASAGFTMIETLERGAATGEDKSGVEIALASTPSLMAASASTPTAASISVPASFGPVPTPAPYTGPIMTMPGVTYATVMSREQMPRASECHFLTQEFPSYRSLVFNEIAWMGSGQDGTKEWIELRNASSGPLNAHDYWIIDQAEQIKIQLPAAMIAPGDFFLLERSEEAVPDVDADHLYAGSLANSSEGLRLFDPWCGLVDEVFADPRWPAGDATSRRSMERGINWQWHTYSGSGDNEIFGTPKKENSIQKNIPVSAVAPPVASTQHVVTQSVSQVPVLASGCGSSKININTATQADLETIIHIGPSLATQIIAARPFGSLDELEVKVRGIGPKYFADILSEGRACAP